MDGVMASVRRIRIGRAGRNDRSGEAPDAIAACQQFTSIHG
jgi:hypothetical protein